MSKLTRYQMYQEIINLLEGGSTEADLQDLIDLCKHEQYYIVQRRIADNKKRMIREYGDVDLMAAIQDILSPTDLMTIEDVTMAAREITGLHDLSQQRIANRLNKLVVAGLVEKRYGKRLHPNGVSTNTCYFRLNE